VDARGKGGEIGYRFQSSANDAISDHDFSSGICIFHTGILPEPG
jgi:hypothetical protein